MGTTEVRLLDYTLVPQERSTVPQYELRKKNTVLGSLSGSTAQRMYELFIMHAEQEEFSMRAYNCHGFVQYLLEQRQKPKWVDNWVPDNRVDVDLATALNHFQFPIGIHMNVRDDTHSALILGKDSEGNPLSVHKRGKSNMEFCHPKTIFQGFARPIVRYYGSPITHRDPSSATPQAHGHGWARIRRFFIKHRKHIAVEDH